MNNNLKVNGTSNLLFIGHSVHMPDAAMQERNLTIQAIKKFKKMERKKKTKWKE